MEHLIQQRFLFFFDRTGEWLSDDDECILVVGDAIAGMVIRSFSIVRFVVCELLLSLVALSSM